MWARFAESCSSLPFYVNWVQVVTSCELGCVGGFVKHVRSVAFTLVVWELGWMVYILGIDCGHLTSTH